MNTATQNTENVLNSIINAPHQDASFQKSLLDLWLDLEKNLEKLTRFGSTSSVHEVENLNKMDQIIDAQDQIANVACQSQAATYEGLLYKLSLWRLDTPDFETMPVNADRKDRIIYSVFQDLIKITGMESVKTQVDKTTNFLTI